MQEIVDIDQGNMYPEVWSHIRIIIEPFTLQHTDSFPGIVSHRNQFIIALEKN